MNLSRLMPLMLLCLSAFLALSACSPKQEAPSKQSAAEEVKKDADAQDNAQAADANKADAAQDNANAQAADANKADAAQEVKSIAIEIFEPEVLWEESNCVNDEGVNDEGAVTCRETIYGSKPEKTCKIEDDIHEAELKKECILNTPFIILQDYKSFNLKPGDEFQASNGGKYKIIDGVPEEAYYFYGCCDGAAQDDLEPSSLHGHTNYKGDDNQIVRISVITAPTNK